MVTMDSDFLILARQGTSHSGIAYAAPNRLIGEMIRAIMLLHDVLTSSEMANQVEFL